jgi:hypothetical protein
LRERFEEELRSLVRARSIAVRDKPVPAASDSPAHYFAFALRFSVQYFFILVETAFAPRPTCDAYGVERGGH